MPELKNEHPSEAELRSYFLEHCPWMRDDYRLDSYDFPGISEVALRFGGVQLKVKIGETIWAGLNWLNQLDRGHTFWTGTNKRPTVYKVFDYALRVYQKDQTNELALWLCAIQDSFFGENDFGQEWWRLLWLSGKLDMHWPIWAGLWNEMMLGYGNDAMGMLLRDMGSPEEAVSILQEIAEAHEERIREWARRALDYAYGDRA